MKQFLVIGLGSFGFSVATSLYQAGQEVLAIDGRMDRVDAIANQVTHAIQADATDEEALKAMGARNFDVAVVAMGNDIRASVLTTLLCKEMGIPFVVAKASDEVHAKLLYKIGADKVVFPERDMGIKVAHNLISPNIQEFLEFSPNYDIAEISPLKDWVGKTLKETDIRTRYGINVIAVKRLGNVIIAPAGEFFMRADDTLVVIGRSDQMLKLETDSVKK